MLGETRRRRLCSARNSWIGKRKTCITSVCMRDTTILCLWWWMGNPIRNSMMAGRMCWQFRFPARWFHWLPCERGRALIPGLAPSPNPWIYAGASAWVEVVWWWCHRLGLPIEEHGSTAYAPKVASRSKTRMAASIHILRSVRRTRNMRTRMCIVPGGLCCGSGRLSRRWAWPCSASPVSSRTMPVASWLCRGVHCSTCRAHGVLAPGCASKARFL